jgi:hypothetical protein
MLPSFAKIQNLEVAGFTRGARAMQLLQRHLFGAPGVRENDIGWSLGVDKLSELQGVEVKEAHLEKCELEPGAEAELAALRNQILQGLV